MENLNRPNLKARTLDNAWKWIALVLTVALIIWLFMYLKTGLSIQSMLKEGNVDEYCRQKYDPYMKLAGNERQDLSWTENISLVEDNV